MLVFSRGSSYTSGVNRGDRKQDSVESDPTSRSYFLQQAAEEGLCSDSNSVSVDQVRPHFIKYIRNGDSRHYKIRLYCIKASITDRQ